MKLLLQSSNDFLINTVKTILKDNNINYVDSEGDFNGYLNIMGAEVVRNESIFVDENEFERAYSLLQGFLEYEPDCDNVYLDDDSMLWLISKDKRKCID